MCSSSWIQFAIQRIFSQWEMYGKNLSGQTLRPIEALFLLLLLAFEGLYTNTKFDYRFMISIDVSLSYYILQIDPLL